MKTNITFVLLLLSAVIASAQTPVKKVMLEEFTTALCGACPPQSYNIHQWYKQHSSNSIFMTHHAGFGTDAMTNAEATTYAKYFAPSTFGFAPAIMIDRDVYPGKDSVPYMSVNGFDSIALRISKNPADLAVGITGSYNSTTRLLTVTATATFINAVAAGEKRFHLYLVEDSLVGTGSGWDQKCSSTSFANQHYPGQYSASNSVIVKYPHRNVQRASLIGGAWGASGIIPNSPVIGTPYSVTATYTLPANINTARVSVVALAANYGATHIYRKVLNANSVKLKDLSNATGIDKPTMAEIHAMYPNPADDNVTLNMTIRKPGNISIVVNNIYGQQVAVFEDGVALREGRYEATFSTKGFSSGLYMVNVISEEGMTTQKLSMKK